VNATHYERRCAQNGALCDTSPCRFGFTCTDGGCRADALQPHLLRAVDVQLVESVNASQLAACSADQGADVAAGYMLCDVWHSTRALLPTFGHILGNTWLQFDATAPPPCGDSPAAWRACVSANIGAQVAALQGESPEMLFSGGLMEFLVDVNLDNQTAFPDSVCRPGSVGQWGGNNTCVPDVTTAAGQEYYLAWGRAFLDAGIRAIFFGQARLTGGSAPDGSDGVSPEGALGFAAVIEGLRAYAGQQGYGAVYFGPQAAASILLPNGTQLADWAYGAQHLEIHNAGPFLTQPLLRNGSWVYQQYGPGDFHDASQANAVFGIPTVLDYDNWSGSPGVYDDIRLLASWPDDARAALVTNHYRYLRAYSPNATITIPISKWLAVPSECLCYANIS
jgi:hypothetical protein